MLKKAIVVMLLCLVTTPTVSADPGIATWYGEEFHGRPMANGQIYDMNDPTTTACNWYPLGQWLLVSLQSDPSRQVRVQVRDRGTFTHALDLSKAAFSLLADLRLGVINVNYQVLDPVANPAQPLPGPVVTITAEEREAGYHIVQPGENLFRIAKAIGTTANALAALNGLANPDQVRAGQKILLNDTAKLGPTLPKATPSPTATSEATPKPQSPPVTDLVQSDPKPSPPAPPAPNPTPVTPTPAPEARPSRLAISRPAWGGAAIVRSEPTTASAPLGQVPLGEQIEVLGTVAGESVNPGEPRWWEVLFDGQTGYVYYVLLDDS
jgi:rare lipoprotein A